MNTWRPTHGCEMQSGLLVLPVTDSVPLGEAAVTATVTAPSLEVQPQLWQLSSYQETPQQE